jgi:hypothetical protein
LTPNYRNTLTSKVSIIEKEKRKKNFFSKVKNINEINIPNDHENCGKKIFDLKKKNQYFE